MTWKESNSEMFTFGNRRNACYKCTDRHVGCHSACKKYASYQKALEKDKEFYKECKRNDIYQLPKVKRERRKSEV